MKSIFQRAKVYWDNIRGCLPALPVLCIFIWGLYQGVTQVRERILFQASGKWPDVVGYITGSNVSYDEGEYFPVIYYYYKIQERFYTGSRVQFGSEYTSSSEAESLVAAYPKGRGVTVYYNPENPQDSVLRKTYNPPHLGDIGLFAVSAAMVIGVVIVAGIVIGGDYFNRICERLWPG